MNRFRERQIGLVKMPMDRYVARKSLPGETGRLLTIPLSVGAIHGLIVNAAASKGTLRVQVRNDRGDVIEGLSFADCANVATNGARLPIRWTNEQETANRFAQLQDKRISLEFELKDASLFAFEFLE